MRLDVSGLVLFCVYSASVSISFGTYSCRDPEFVFYDGDTYKMSAYGVKPAVFDLFLGLIIAAYLSAIYLLVQVSCHKVHKTTRSLEA